MKCYNLISPGHPYIFYVVAKDLHSYIPCKNVLEVVPKDPNQLRVCEPVQQAWCSLTCSQSTCEMYSSQRSIIDVHCTGSMSLHWFKFFQKYNYDKHMYVMPNSHKRLKRQMLISLSFSSPLAVIQLEGVAIQHAPLCMSSLMNI